MGGGVGVGVGVGVGGGVYWGGVWGCGVCGGRGVWGGGGGGGGGWGAGLKRERKTVALHKPTCELGLANLTAWIQNRLLPYLFCTFR